MLLLGHPVVKLFLGHGLHDDRHARVPGAAQFGALAAEGAFAIEIDPGLGDIAGDGILFHRQLWHPKGMVDVGGGVQEADLGAHRQDQGIVHRAQVVGTGLVLREVAALDADVLGLAFHLHLMIQVLVLPPPLVAHDLDIHEVFALGDFPDLYQGLMGGIGYGQVHAQYQDGDDHPGPAPEP